MTEYKMCDTHQQFTSRLQQQPAISCAKPNRTLIVVAANQKTAIRIYFVTI